MVRAGAGAEEGSASEGAEERDAPGARGAAPRRRLALLGAALLVPIVPFVLLGELPGPEWLARVDDPLEVGAIGAGLLTLDVLLPVPSTAVGSALGARLGFVSGALWCWGGLVAGNLLGFAVGRLAGARARVALPHLGTSLVLLVTRPVPILAEAAAIAAAAGGVPVSSLLAASLVGNAVFALALAGSGVALVSARWAGVGLVLPLGLPVLGWLLLRRLRRRMERG